MKMSDGKGYKLRPEYRRGLRQMLNKEQEDEGYDATKMMVVMLPG